MAAYFNLLLNKGSVISRRSVGRRIIGLVTGRRIEGCHLIP
ncbi:hypothetical protein [Alkaliphilus crotonatoxidans]